MSIAANMLKISTRVGVQRNCQITFMLMLQRLFLFVVMIQLAQMSLAQKPGTVIIHEPAFRYTITAPSGWVYDTEMAKEMRLSVVFYPDTTKWTKSPIVMYVNPTVKLDSNQTVEEVAQMDIKNFQKDSPEVKAAYFKTLKTYPQGFDCLVYKFENQAKNNYELVAYIEHGYHVLMIVMGTRNKNLFKQNEAAFDRLVTSYFDLNKKG
jgi:hypothetical protein